MNPAPYPDAATLAKWEKKPSAAPFDFVPLHLETRTHVSTAVLCRHLNRKEQTARGWASANPPKFGANSQRIVPGRSRPRKPNHVKPHPSCSYKA